MGTQTNSLCRCVISGWLGWVFLQASALVFSVQTQADMMRKGPLTLRALSELVLMQSLDLVPLSVNLQNSLHLVLISWSSLHGCIFDQWLYILHWWQRPQHLSLQEPFEQNLSMGQKLPYWPFSVQATVTIVLFGYFCLPFSPWWSRALLTMRDSGICFRDIPAMYSSYGTQLHQSTAQSVETAAQSWGVSWRSHNKFVDK